MKSPLPVRMLVLLVVLAACSGSAPPVPPPAPPTTPEPRPPVAPVPPPEPVNHRPTRLGNGLEVVVTEAPTNGDALLQLGFRCGSLTTAPALAEFAVEAIVAGADASQGRPPLTAAIANLGGIVRTDTGATTTWIAIRVPGARWQDAQTALLAALTAPARTRSQLERIREDLVDTITAEIGARPAVAMAHALLAGEADTAAHVRSVLDRDPSEVGLFQARFFRPENAIWTLHVPGDPGATAAALAKPIAGSLAHWSPPALSSPTTKTVAARPSTGVVWKENKAAPCRASLLTFLPDLGRADAATLLLLHACVTLDGTGGRLERLQNERGLGHVQWSTEIVPGAERTILVMSTDVAANDVTKLWATIDAARRSVRDVPLTPSERDLAQRGAHLTAGLGRLDAFARHRLPIQLRERGTSVAAIESSAGVLDGSGKYAESVEAFLASPVVLFVNGGAIPAEAADVRRIELLPAGFTPARATPAAAPPVAGAPWLDRAAEAIGSLALLRRYRGHDAESRMQTESAPSAKETLAWRTDGNVRRTREVLGNRIETRIEGDQQIEILGDDKHALSPRETALLRREMQRHPIALLAAHAQGQLAFRDIAQRTAFDRELMILQAEGDRFDRLRVHIDTMSRLIRAVEVWETLPDGTTVHLHDAWSDYRTVDGLRVPFRRVTTQDDGQNRVETVFTKWQPLLVAP